MFVQKYKSFIVESSDVLTKSNLLGGFIKVAIKKCREHIGNIE